MGDLTRNLSVVILRNKVALKTLPEKYTHRYLNSKSKCENKITEDVFFREVQLTHYCVAKNGLTEHWNEK